MTKDKSPEKLYARHIEAIKRRREYLSGKQRNSYDNAELKALNWVLYHTTYTREDIARAIDSVEHHELYKKLRS